MSMLKIQKKTKKKLEIIKYVFCKILHCLEDTISIPCLQILKIER